MDIQSPDALRRMSDRDNKNMHPEATSGNGASGRRVLIITNHLTYAIHHRQHLFERLQDEGYVITLAGTGTQAELTQLAGLGLDTRQLDVVSYKMNPIADLGLVPAIRKLISEVQPDILHLFTPKVIACGKIANSLIPQAQRPSHMVLSLTGLGRLFLPDAPAHHRVVRTALLRLLQWRSKNGTQTITTETTADRDELNALAPGTGSQVTVTHGTGIDLDAYQPTTRTGPVTFLFSGRLLKSKGVEAFAAAARHAIAAGIDAHFMIAGSFDIQDDDCASTDLFDDLAPNSQVTLLGAVPAKDMPSILQQTDVVCLPTRYKEGIPRTLLEGAASGCAFIACRTPGWVETVGQTPASGWFVEPDDVPALTEIMRRLAADPRQTRQAGVAARQNIETARVSESDVQTRYLNAYSLPTVPD